MDMPDDAPPGVTRYRVRGVTRIRVVRKDPARGDYLHAKITVRGADGCDVILEEMFVLEAVVARVERLLLDGLDAFWDR